MTATAVNKELGEQGLVVLDALIAGYLASDTEVRSQCVKALHACGNAAVDYLEYVAEVRPKAQQARLATLAKWIATHESTNRDRCRATLEALVACLRVNHAALNEAAYRALTCLPMLADALVSRAIVNHKNSAFCRRLLQAASLVVDNLSSSARLELLTLLGLTDHPLVRLEVVSLMESIRQRPATLR